MAALRDELDAAALRGLASAATALLGDDGPAVCAALARRDASGLPALPWLAGPCFSALSPLGAVAPGESEAWVVTRFLVGAEHDAPTVSAAAEACRSLARRRSGAVGPAASEAVAASSRVLWRRTLVGAVDDAFARVAEGYARLRAAVLADGDDEVRAVAERAAGPIRAAAVRVEELAVFVAGSQPELAGPPVGVADPKVPASPPASHPPSPTPPVGRPLWSRPTPEPVRPPSGWSRPPQEPVRSPARWLRPPAEPAARPSRRDPVWPAVAFVVVALAVAAALLWLVLEGRLPGLAA